MNYRRVRRDQIALLLVVVSCASLARAEDQRRDMAVLVEERDEYRARLLEKADGKSTMPASRPASPLKRVLRPDLSGRDMPKSPEEFQQAWHQRPICQGLTGYCWAFGSTSFLESEVQRLGGQKVKLSESWVVYWEFVEKARGFVRTRGQSAFPRGSEPNATLRVFQKYGLVPAAAYPGLPAGREFYDDRAMYAEMSGYLDSLKRAGKWDEPATTAKIRSILDRHVGTPPEKMDIGGKSISPQEYGRDVLGTEPGACVFLMSLMQEPWHEYCRLDVPDNWWRSRGFYNLPLEEFARVIREVLQAGGSVGLVMDNTEPGFYSRENVAVVPTFDIPAELIDDAARQMRFSNESTTDEHVVHLVGWREHQGRYWYLVKDSGTAAQNGHYPGYMFYEEGYVKLKGLAAMVPRDLVEAALKRALPAAPSEPYDAAETKASATGDK